MSDDETSWCPSAQPDMNGALLFGVVTETPEGSVVGYLNRPLAASGWAKEMAGTLEPTEVFRFAAPCAEGRCVHYSGSECSLAERVTHVPVAIKMRLPKCAIRPRCRWWKERGIEACRRCPTIITRDYQPTTAMASAAAPAADARSLD